MSKKKSKKLGEARLDSTQTPDTYERQFEGLENEPPKEKMTFDAWFSLRLSDRAWLRDAVKSFMKSEGLRDEEEIETFDHIFKKF